MPICGSKTQAEKARAVHFYKGLGPHKIVEAGANQYKFITILHFINISNSTMNTKSNAWCVCESWGQRAPNPNYFYNKGKVHKTCPSASNLYCELLFPSFSLFNFAISAIACPVWAIFWIENLKGNFRRRQGGHMLQFLLNFRLLL